MYIRMQAQVKFCTYNIMYNTEGVDRDLPQFIFGERHYIQFLQQLVEQDVPLNNFQAMVHPAPPLRLGHTLWGSRLTVLGLQVLLS